MSLSVISMNGVIFILVAVFKDLDTSSVDQSLIMISDKIRCKYKCSATYI